MPINVYYGEEIGLEGAFNAGTRRSMPWASPGEHNKDLLSLYRRLAALQRNNQVIKNGKFEFLKEYCDGEALVFRRTLPGKAWSDC